MYNRTPGQLRLKFRLVYAWIGAAEDEWPLRWQTPLLSNR